MKKLILALICLSISMVYSTAQTADDIITKHLAALGGSEKLRTIQTVSMEAKVSAQGMEIPMSFKTANNKGWRMDISVMGMTGWMIVTQDSGWIFMPFQGQTKPDAIPADVLSESIEQLDAQGMLCDYKEKGHQVEYLGMDDVEGTECYKLKVTSKNGKVSYYLIDPASNYIVRVLSKQKAAGKEVDAQVDFSNYKKIDGDFIFPHTIASIQGPLDVTKVVVNAPMDDSIFMKGN
ncbi:MAG: outer membrane lipoprotein-sorting protein [Bacteroidota bacterium]|nr:outer membrane lipoprotein-sorting protein [Bacteroidota bacterium]